MIEILKTSPGIKTECYLCGTVLKFQLWDMKKLEPEDYEYSEFPEQAPFLKYINCPLCENKCFVRDDRKGWINGTARIYEDKEEEKV